MTKTFKNQHLFNQIFGHSLGVVAVGLGVYTIVDESTKLINSELADQFEKLANDIETEIKILTDSRDIYLKKVK